MEEWKDITIREIAILKNGKKKPSAQGLIPVYGGNGIMDYVDSHNDEDCIAIGRVGAYCGCVYLTKGKVWISDNAISAKANSNANNIFLYYLLGSLNLNRYRIGGAQPLMTQDLIGRIKVSLPSIEEQRSIASILSSLDDKIAVNRRICENLEGQAQALFKHWFIDFAPFKNGKFVESELGMIPEGWRVGSPYKYVDFIYGAPYKSNLFNDKKEGLPLIRIRDLKDCSPQFYTPEILPKTEYVKAGDILAGMDAEFAPYIWKGQKGLLNQRVCKIKPKNTSIGRLFCMLLVKPQLLFVQAVKTGTTVSHIGKSDIDRFKVVLPPFEEVVRFSIIGEEILEAIVTLSAENLRLSTLRDTLLPKLMSGQIKV
ncbi:MAG: restriction endonuclease subunit S [Bacteroidaceae bacterium]|nr:restriction endonuclease subunit S [Bacteroidaceae bacterium]